MLWDAYCEAPISSQSISDFTDDDYKRFHHDNMQALKFRQEVFLDRFDKNRDGNIDRELFRDYKIAYKEQQRRDHARIAALALERWDANGDGRISYDEAYKPISLFADLHAVAVRSDEERKRLRHRMMLKHFDLDGNGRLCEAEHGLAETFEDAALSFGIARESDFVQIGRVFAIYIPPEEEEPDYE